ncbi:hypothetical protein Aglo01_19490 [Actinokineospora globicatena]|nr:hypothetical protein Aglo01_19490 [Actinokineospora globicatena]GLW84301.1 hypothetical protein Aglo02_19410 [Actinokineospora globicatena]
MPTARGYGRPVARGHRGPRARRVSARRGLKLLRTVAPFLGLPLVRHALPYLLPLTRG